MSRDRLFPCTNGRRTSSPILCSEYEDTSSCGSHLWIPNVCPEGYCVWDDSDCMRACGTTFKFGSSTYEYNTTCEFWPGQCARTLPSSGRCREQSPECKTPCDGGDKCIKRGWRCDNIRQCSDGSDERSCPCSNSNARCPNSTCIEDSWKCDGIEDCSDGRDELYCPDNGGVNDETGNHASTATAVVPLAIGGAVIAVIVMIICLIIVYKNRSKISNPNHQRSGNQPSHNSATRIPMRNLLFEMPSAPFNQSAPSYDDLTQPSAPPTTQTNLPYLQHNGIVQSFIAPGGGDTPYTQRNDQGASIPNPPLAPPNHSSTDLGPPSYRSLTITGGTPPHLASTAFDAPPSYETVMGQGFYEGHSNTDDGGGE